MYDFILYKFDIGSKFFGFELCIKYVQSFGFIQLYGLPEPKAPSKQQWQEKLCFNRRKP